MAPLFLKKNSMQYFPGVLDHVKILREIMEKKVGEPTFNVHPIIHRCVADFVNGKLLEYSYMITLVIVVVIVLPITKTFLLITTYLYCTNVVYNTKY